MADETPPMRVAIGTDPNGTIIGTTMPGAHRPTDYKTVTLRFEAGHNGADSAAAGRPVYDKVLMLRLMYPGSTDTLDVEVKRYPSDGSDPVVVDEGRHAMFRELIERFEATGEATATGTPLGTINLAPDQVANLAALGVKTVEQLADIPDSALGGLKAGGRAMRDRARAYMEAVAGGEPMARLTAENEGLRGDMDELRRQLQELQAERKAEKAAAADADTAKKGK